MVNELKPCPLCGGEAGLWKAHPENPKRPAWVGCMARCCVLVTREYECTEEAITAWNTRADTGRLSELEAEVAALKAQGFTLKQATHCAVCGQFKHTPLRRDEMGGYVCMTCIDSALDARAALRSQS